MSWKRNNFLIVGCFCAGMLCCIPAFSAFMSENADELVKKARGDDADAQFRLGYEYFFGEKSRKQDITRGVYWFRRAAKTRHPEALYNLAVATEFGWGCEKNLHRAFALYEDAWNVGVNAAGLRLAKFLFHGVPEEPTDRKPIPAIPADAKRAAEVFRRLVELDYLPAWREFAHFCMRHAEAPEAEKRQIRRMLYHAAEGGKDPIAWRLLAECYREGIDGSPNEKSTLDALNHAAELGDAEAHFELAECFEFGLGVPADWKRAFEHTKIAAEKKSLRGKTRLADYYLQGVLCPADIPRAIALYQEAAAEKHAPAISRLADCYAAGIGMKQDLYRAAELYGQGARAGDGRSQYKYGMCFLKGLGVSADPVGAVFWFRQAVRLRQVEAMREYGLCLIKGWGTTRNVQEGRRLIENAAALGDGESIEFLNR